MRRPLRTTKLVLCLLVCLLVASASAKDKHPETVHHAEHPAQQFFGVAEDTGEAHPSALGAGYPPQLPKETLVMLEAKDTAGLKWSDLESQLGLDEVYLAALLYNSASVNASTASKLMSALGLDVRRHPGVFKQLTRYPLKGRLLHLPPEDPMIYRLWEILQVQGRSMKDVMHEKFGDGIMSAGDFTLTVDRIEAGGLGSGDRCKITLNGKWLPYAPW